MHNTGINWNQKAPGIWISPTLTNFKEMHSNQNPLYFCSTWTLPSVNPGAQLNCHVLLNGGFLQFSKSTNDSAYLQSSMSRTNVPNIVPNILMHHCTGGQGAMALGGASQKDVVSYSIGKPCCCSLQQLPKGLHVIW
jgi:hypothetical protein